MLVHVVRVITGIRLYFLRKKGQKLYPTNAGYKYSPHLFLEYLNTLLTLMFVYFRQVFLLETNHSTPVMLVKVRYYVTYFFKYVQHQ
jgi:hypothetical protein